MDVALAFDCYGCWTMVIIMLIDNNKRPNSTYDHRSLKIFFHRSLIISIFHLSLTHLLISFNEVLNRFLSIEFFSLFMLDYKLNHYKRYINYPFVMYDLIIHFSLIFLFTSSHSAVFHNSTLLTTLLRNDILLQIYLQQILNRIAGSFEIDIHCMVM